MLEMSVVLLVREYGTICLYLSNAGWPFLPIITDVFVVHVEDCYDWLLHVRWYGSCVAGDAVINDIVESVSGVKLAGSVCLSMLWL